jgi:hypothetical protein
MFLLTYAHIQQQQCHLDHKVMDGETPLRTLMQHRLAATVLTVEVRSLLIQRVQDIRVVGAVV